MANWRPVVSAGLDADQDVVDDDRSDAVVIRAKDSAKVSQHAELATKFEVVNCGEQTFKVRRLVRQRGLDELDVSLLHGGTKNDLATDAHGRRLRASDQLGHV